MIWEVVPVSTAVLQSAGQHFVDLIEEILTREDTICFSNDIIDIIDNREGNEGISVDVRLAKVQVGRKQVQVALGIEIAQNGTLVVTEEGREIPDYLLDRHADFKLAVDRVTEAVSVLRERDLEALRSQAIRQEWAEADTAAEQEETELDELSMELENGLGNPHRRFDRRQVVRLAIRNLTHPKLKRL